MSSLYDATTRDFIRPATQTEEDASDHAAAESYQADTYDHRGVFALPCGRQVYVPLERLHGDEPIGGPGGD